MDRNADGKITKEEISARMQELILGRVDANKDDVIDQVELEQLENTESKAAKIEPGR